MLLGEKTFSIEFWVLLGIYIVMHGLTFGIALAIYWRQQAFNKEMFGAVTAAISEIKADIRNPLTMVDIGRGIGQQVWYFLRSQMGNLSKSGLMPSGNGEKGSVGTALMSFLFSKGNVKNRLKNAAGAYYGQTTAKGILENGQDMEIRGNYVSVKVNLPESDQEAKRLKEFSEFVDTVMTEEQKEKIEKKRVDLLAGHT